MLLKGLHAHAPQELVKRHQTTLTSSNLAMQNMSRLFLEHDGGRAFEKCAWVMLQK